MKNHFTRRRFLATVGATAGAALVGESLFNISNVSAMAPLQRTHM